MWLNAYDESKCSGSSDYEILDGQNESIKILYG